MTISEEVGNQNIYKNWRGKKKKKQRLRGKKYWGKLLKVVMGTKLRSVVSKMLHASKNNDIKSTPKKGPDLPALTN